VITTTSSPSRFTFLGLLFALVWVVWAILNFWIWKKTKALGNLLMLIGSAALALFMFINLFTWNGPGAWMDFFALCTVTAGFFLSVKPVVDAQLAALKSKMQNLTAKKEGGGTPPPAS
jgi:hypothetical protein